mgnify:CR=1 FL=1
MLDAFPIYHWFHNGNPYSGAEQGMRYVITPGKKADPADESGKRKIEFLTVTVWPGPWSVEHTAEEKIRSAEFEGSQAGLDAAVAGCMSATRVICPVGRTSRPFWTASRIADGPAQ